MQHPTWNVRPPSRLAWKGLPAALSLALLGPVAVAQTTQARQVVKPPQAQAWIDLATISAIGVPAMGQGGSPMAVLGSLLGGGAKNQFGNTQSGGGAGRWMDVTLYARPSPALQEATMSVPAASQLAPTLRLVAPRAQKSAPVPDDDSIVEDTTEMPRGKVSLYWGCGDTVRPGQPRTVDFARAQAAELMQVFKGRRATQRGAHSALGRPLWPNEHDARVVPDGASLAGEHGFQGQGVPEGWRFTLPPAHDLMPALALRQADAGGATRLAWAALPTARAYFFAVMGGKEGEDEHMVLWTSSELPDSGFGLLDYQTNAAVDRWLKDKVLLAPGVTECTVPRGVFAAGGAMLRAIAYGNELNLVHPPRPSDPKLAWEPQWAVKVRVKSEASTLLGIDDAGDEPRAATDPRPEPKREGPASVLPKAGEVLRGIFGR